MSTLISRNDGDNTKWYGISGGVVWLFQTEYPKQKSTRRRIQHFYF